MSAAWERHAMCESGFTGTTILFHKSDIPPTRDGTGAWSITCRALPCALLTKFRPFYLYPFVSFNIFLLAIHFFLSLTCYKHLVSAT